MNAFVRPLWERALEARGAEAQAAKAQGHGRPRFGVRLWVITRVAAGFELRVSAEGVPALEPLGVFESVEAARDVLADSASTALLRLDPDAEQAAVNVIEFWTTKTVAERITKARARLGGAR